MFRKSSKKQLTCRHAASHHHTKQPWLASWQKVGADCCFSVNKQQCYAFQTFSLRTTVSRVVASRTIIIILQAIYKPFWEMVLESLIKREREKMGPHSATCWCQQRVEPTSVLASPWKNIKPITKSILGQFHIVEKKGIAAACSWFNTICTKLALQRCNSWQWQCHKCR